MTAATRRKIVQLRALAASTTFPEEAASARAKADKLEAALPKMDHSTDALNFDDAWARMAADLSRYQAQFNASEAQQQQDALRRAEAKHREWLQAHLDQFRDMMRGPY